MARIQVSLQSTALSGASYDPDTEQLEVTFASGGTYTFERVPQAVFEELRDSPSPGQFYHQQIKGQY
jgi:lysyl-tRNA synthetase class 2